LIINLRSDREGQECEGDFHSAGIQSSSTLEPDLLFDTFTL